MIIKKFVANTEQEAVMMAKEEMGSNAVVRLSDCRLLITDLDENRFEIRDVFALSQKEQRKLDLFL